MNELEIFRASHNTIEINVIFDKDTLWLNRQQLALFFERNIKTIGKHINHVFEDAELYRNPTVVKFATVQKEGNRSIESEIEHYISS